MNGYAKAAIVVAGYIGAFALALAVTAAHIAATDNAQAQAASGMYAFGDMLLFAGVFGFAALVPTAAAAFFLFKAWSRRV